MKYFVETWTNDLIGVRAIVNVRSDARHITMVKKSLQAIYDELHRLGLIGESANVHIERPNIWVNGGMGFISLTDSEHQYTISISNEHGAYMYS